jgi:hypothetical protein
MDNKKVGEAYRLEKLWAGEFGDAYVERYPSFRLCGYYDTVS